MWYNVLWYVNLINHYNKNAMQEKITSIVEENIP